MLIKIAFRNVFRNGRRSAITLLVIVMGAVGLILFGGYKARTFWALRESTIRFFAALPADAWTRVGVAGGNNLSVRATAHIIVGHTKHHLQSLAERYDVPTIQ